MAEHRKQALISALCRGPPFDPKPFIDEIEKFDIQRLCGDILKSSQNGSSLLGNDEVLKWIAFADRFPLDTESCFAVLKQLNDEVAQKSVLLGDGLKPSEVDVIVFAVIHHVVIGMSRPDLQKLPHVTRWMDYIWNKADVGELFETIPLEKAKFEPQMPKGAAKGGANSNAKDEKTSKKDAPEKKAKGGKEAAEEKKKTEKDSEVSVSLLNIQIGLIRKAWKHPSADSLLVEEIDVGEPKLRQVVSGLAKHCSPDDLVNRRVALITNVKPGKLRDVLSEGLVLCASYEDHSVVEPLLPPEGAKVGERVSISGHEGKPEDVLNPKKKQLEKITPHLYTDEKGVTTYKGIPFMTSAGPCTSSLPKASIK